MAEENSVEKELERPEPIYPVAVAPVTHSFTEDEVQLDWAAALNHNSQPKEES